MATAGAVRPAPYIDREQAVVRFLKDIPEPSSGAPVKEIWEGVTARLRENVSLSAYHKVIDKMVAQHKLEEIAPSNPQSPWRYKVAPHLFPENALTLDDLYENLWRMAPGDAVAHYVDALDYFEEKQSSTLAAAAKALQSEEPVALVHDMLADKIELINKSLALWHEKDAQEDTLKQGIVRDHQRLCDFVYHHLGIAPTVLDLRDIDTLLVHTNMHIDFDPTVRDTLTRRIVGDSFIITVDVTQALSAQDQRRAVVVGSDGSTHAGVLTGVTAPRFFDDPPGQIISFNNSIAFYEYGDADIAPEYPITGVPMSRAALSDPSNRGMVMAPFMFPGLDESEYEHMKKSATDVVQLRVDEKVVTGSARSLGPRMEKLPRPTVVIRDGTVVPQEREFQHYTRRDEYGEMVQEGIALSNSILSAVNTAPVIYAGAVKFSQLRVFTEILNWYIVRGSRIRSGQPLDPNWDVSRAGHISDNAAMSRLLASLPPSAKGRYNCTCAIIRPFYALTTRLRRDKRITRDMRHNAWVQLFTEIRDTQMLEYNRNGGERPYLDTVDIAADPYPRMCSDADYAMFYVGHTAGDPGPTAPRYEFLDSLRRLGTTELQARVREKVARIVSCLHLTGFSLDREHNYFSTKVLVKIIPYVVFNAHEQCKVLGHKLEAELKSEVVARLNELKNVRGLIPSHTNIIPMELQRYIEQSRRATDEDTAPSKSKDPEER